MAGQTAHDASVGLLYNTSFLQEDLFVEAASSGDVLKVNTLIAQLRDYILSGDRLEGSTRRKQFMKGQAMCYRGLQSAAENGHADIVKEVLCFVRGSNSLRDYAFLESDRNVDLGGFLSKRHEDNLDLDHRMLCKWCFAGAPGIVFSSPLHLAVREGHLHVVEELIPKMNSKAVSRGWFKGLVEWAVRWGHAPILEFLITQEPFIHHEGDDNKKIPIPLSLAIYHNHFNILDLLLPQKIDLDPAFEVSLDDAAKDGLTALHLAALAAPAAIVKLLVSDAVQLKLNVCSRSQPELFTPLHVAADCGNLAVVQLLLSPQPTQWNLADALMVKDCMGRTALHYAARQGHEDIVQELLNSSLHMQQTAGRADITCIADRDGLLPLHMAARSGHAGVIEKLLNASLNTINQKAKHSRGVKDWVEKEFTNMGPWHQGTMYHGELYRFPRPKMFDSLFFETKGFTPLHFAARYGHKAALLQLLKADSDLNVTDERGFSAYHWMEVQDKGHVFQECMKELQVNGGRLGSIKQAAGGKRMSKEMMTQIAADVVNEEKAMENIWHASCSYGSKQCRPRLTAAVVRWLEEGDSPGRLVRSWLPWAAAQGDIELVKSLLEGGLEANKEYEAMKISKAEQLQNSVYEAVEEALDKVFEPGAWIMDGSRRVEMVRELLLKLPSGNIRATTATKTLRSLLAGPTGLAGLKEIVLLGKEGAAVSELQEMAKVIENDIKVFNITYDKSQSKEMRDLLVAVVGLAESLPSNLLRKLLESAAKLQDSGLVQVILDQPQVKKGLYEDRQVYLDGANAILVGAALIAGLAFQSWLQPPLGYNYTYEGENYADVHKWGVRMFWRFNNGAFYLSVASLIAGAKGAVPVANEVDIVGSVKKAKRAVAVASSLLAMALVCVVVAFTLAQVAVLPPLPSDQEIVHTSVGWGGAICGLALLWFSVSIVPLLVRSLPDKILTWLEGSRLSLSLRFVWRHLRCVWRHLNSLCNKAWRDRERERNDDYDRRVNRVAWELYRRWEEEKHI